jgi:hypothetical protein
MEEISGRWLPCPGLNREKDSSSKKKKEERVLQRGGLLSLSSLGECRWRLG